MNSSYSRSRFEAVATIPQRLVNGWTWRGQGAGEEATQWVKSKAVDGSLFLG